MWEVTTPVFKTGKCENIISPCIKPWENLCKKVASCLRGATVLILLCLYIGISNALFLTLLSIISLSLFNFLLRLTRSLFYFFLCVSLSGVINVQIYILYLYNIHYSTFYICLSFRLQFLSIYYFLILSVSPFTHLIFSLSPFYS